MAGKADLHIHTTYSDGKISPFEVLNLAVAKGLKAISITDHDTIKGYLKAEEILKSEQLPIELITGAEFTTTFNDKDIHLLGYFFDPYHKELSEYLTACSVQRRRRMKSMIDWLNKKNIEIDFQEVQAISKHATLARPHLARVLVEKNYVSNHIEAFQRYLVAAHEETRQPYFLEANTLIALIRRAGGAVILAHPGKLFTQQELEELRILGIDGIECIHPSHSYQQHNHFVKWAQKHHLLQTGGSDYHGHPDYGYTPIGTVATSYNNVIKMKAMTTQRKALKPTN